MFKKAYGKSILSKSLVYDRYKAFKDGRETVEDMARSGRTLTSTTDVNIKKVKEIVLENRHASVREIGREADRLILGDNLGKRWVNARLVPKELNFLQKDHRVQRF